MEFKNTTNQRQTLSGYIDGQLRSFSLAPRTSMSVSFAALTAATQALLNSRTIKAIPRSPVDNTRQPPVDWRQVTNVPASFPPAKHTHTLGEIVELQAHLSQMISQVVLDNAVANLTGSLEEKADLIDGKLDSAQMPDEFDVRLSVLSGDLDTLNETVPGENEVMVDDTDANRPRVRIGKNNTALDVANMAGGSLSIQAFDLVMLLQGPGASNIGAPSPIFIVHGSSTKPSAIAVTTSTGYARGINPDGTSTPVVGTGNPASVLTPVFNTYASPWNAYIMKAFGIYSCNSAGNSATGELLTVEDVGIHQANLVDLSRATKLKELRLGGPTAVCDLSNCPELELFWCGQYNNQYLDLYTQDSRLEHIALTCPRLKSLDISHLTGLQSLVLNAPASLTSLGDLTGLTELVLIDVRGSRISKIDVRDKLALQEAYFSVTDTLASVLLSGCPELFKVMMDGCPNIQTLDVGGCPKLEWLECSGCSTLSEITNIADATDGFIDNVHGYATISIASCNFSAEGLNALFAQLPIVGAPGSNTVPIYISLNPGTATCDTSIATARGWSVS